MPLPPKAASRTTRAARAFARLVSVMSDLRSPRGCPWDRRQTHATLRRYLLEETYEVLDAIDRRDLDALTDELGDVLFQVVFHAEVAHGSGRFDISDVIGGVTRKLIRRHPHVFTPGGKLLARRARAGRTAAQSPVAVVEQWDAIKANERAAAGDRPRVLAGVPRALPALLRAHKIGARVAAVGFDWPDTAGVMDKIEEEVGELGAAIREGHARTAEEMGDLLFSLANLSRQLDVDPEAALRAANDKFTRRFDALEALLERRGRRVHEATHDELETAWAVVKRPRATRASSRSVRGSTVPARRARRSRR